jgi:hypothetical protein
LETLAAWKTSVRAGISRPEVAVAQVRQRQLLACLDEPERIRFAIGALGGRPGVHELRVWLADRGHLVAIDALERTLATLATVTRTDHPPAAVAAPRALSPRALSPRAPDARAQRAGRPAQAGERHGNAALRAQVAASYASLLAGGQITAELRSLRVAELIGEHAGLPHSARTLQRYVQELRRQPTPPAPAARAEPARQPPAAGEGLRLVGDRPTTAEPATAPAGTTAQPGLRTS